jgi:voltage-gated potassium channel
MHDPGERTSSQGRQDARRAVATAGLILLATVVYFLIPTPSRMREASWAVLFSCGTAALGIGIIVAIRRLLRAAEQQRIRALVMMLCVTVLFFSWTDVVVAKIPGQFVDLHTKTDAVYFSVSTLATVGFGDVHPSGELARAAVTIQILFNLVFLGAAVATISGLWRQRTSHRLAGHRDGRAEEHGGG